VDKEVSRPNSATSFQALSVSRRIVVVTAVQVARGVMKFHATASRLGPCS